MKYLILILTLSATLTSCGSNSSSQDNPSVTPAPQKPAVSTSYYVSTASALKTCDETSKGFLAYVEDVKQFQACLTSGWTVVDIKGKDGASGQAGTNGTNGTNGTMVSSNQWYDAISQKMWVMTTIATTITSWSNSMSACTGTYRMPSPTEVQTALIHGMKATAQALVNPPTFILANDGSPYTVSAGTQGSASTAAQFCIAQ